MITKNYTDSFDVSISNASMANITMIKDLPSFITKNLNIEEIHIQIIKEAIYCFGFLIEVSGHKYSFKDFARMIKNYYTVVGNGKVEWYYNYLMCAN